MIAFNKSSYTGNEDKYVLESMRSNKISGDGYYSQKCQTWFKNQLGCEQALLTGSCTHALEIAAILIDIHPGDEVIMPSYTFVSTANPFVLRGAKIIFVDIRPDTMNIDETKIEFAITAKTKAIVPVHYGGVACEMDSIMALAKKYNLFVIEDAAQGMMATYKGKPLGTIGDIGSFSFHETKNYTSAGEGGLLIINNKKFAERAEIIREKGTNRNKFFRGEVDKYSWVDIGSSYLLNDVSAAYLWGQIETSDEINNNRLNSWKLYSKNLKILEEQGFIEFSIIPKNCIHNAHLFYIKVESLQIRVKLLNYLKQNEIGAVFHYIPLHSAPAGIQYGVFKGADNFTTKESERIIRLPMYYGLTPKKINIISKTIKDFFNET